LPTVYVAIIVGFAVLVALVCLFGWYRHKLELDGQRIVAAYYFAVRSLADARGEDDQKKLPE
jgi:hypothetical protein